MKDIPHKLFTIVIIFMSIGLSAQQNYVFKGKYLMGGLIPTPGINNIDVLGPIIGGEFSWEILPLGD